MFTSTFTFTALLLASVASAIPARMPRPTPGPKLHEARAHAVKAGTAVSTAPPLSTPLPGTGRFSNGTNSTRTFAYTFSNTNYGFIVGCDETTVITTSESYVPPGTYCKTEGVTLSTDLAIAHTTDPLNDPAIATAYSWTHDPNGYTGPSNGCSVVKTSISSIASTTMTYCTCGNGEMADLTLGVSGTTSTTVCGGTATAMPSGYTSVPYFGGPSWATPASTGACATPTALSADCWDSLDIEGYANWWWSANSKTCEPQGNFADCFMSRMTPYTGSECANLTSDANKCKEPQWSDFENVWNGARIFYLATTISNVNGFFTQYWNAIGAASTIAGEGLQNVVTTIAPDTTTNYGLNAAMAALSAGLAFVPGVGGPFASAIITAAQQVPGLARFAFPTGDTAEDQTLDAAKIGDELGVLTGQLQGNVTMALGEAQTDVNTFVAIAKNGPYSGDLPQIDDLKNQILTGLNTYIISQAYNATHTIITRQVDTDVNELGTNGTKLLWTPCNSGYYSNGTCGEGDFWFDNSTRISYGLSAKDDPTTRFNTQMNQFLSQTTGELLFAGADTCQQQHGGSGPIVDFSSGKFATPCLSSIKVCTWTMDPSKPGSNGPLLSDCDLKSSLPGIGRGSCASQNPNDIGYDSSEGTILPWSYLGWGILQDETKEHDFCEPYKASEF